MAAEESSKLDVVRPGVTATLFATRQTDPWGVWSFRGSRSALRRVGLITEQDRIPLPRGRTISGAKRTPDNRADNSALVTISCDTTGRLRVQLGLVIAARRDLEFRRFLARAIGGLEASGHGAA